MTDVQRAETADDDLILQTSRVDALTKICDALEQQVRETAIKNGCPPNKTDIAARWRQEAYKVEPFPEAFFNENILVSCTNEPF